jgi:hypothetical protein
MIGKCHLCQDVGRVMELWKIEWLFEHLRLIFHILY